METQYKDDLTEYLCRNLLANVYRIIVFAEMRLLIDRYGKCEIRVYAADNRIKTRSSNVDMGVRRMKRVRAAIEAALRKPETETQ